MLLIIQRFFSIFGSGASREPYKSLGCPSSSVPNFVTNFEYCDWSMRFNGVILLSLSLVNIWHSQTTLCFVQSKSPIGLSVYKCTEAGINSSKTVPSKVCASQVSQTTRVTCLSTNFYITVPSKVCTLYFLTKHFCHSQHSK